MDEIVCQSDINEDFRVRVFGPRKDTTFTNKMDQFVKERFSHWTKSIRENGNLSAAELSTDFSVSTSKLPSIRVCA